MSFLLMTSLVQSCCFLFKRNEDQNDPSFSQRILLWESDSYIVPDLSEELFGKSFSVGVTAGLPIPELLLLLDRCWTTGLMGRIGGGLSWAPASRAERAGLNVVIISVVELLLRLIAASGSLIMMVWRGLAGSELTEPICGFFIGSRVSRTTSGACFTVFCLSSSRSSFRAVLMVFSMSCKHRNTNRMWPFLELDEDLVSFLIYFRQKVWYRWNNDSRKNLHGNWWQ